MSFTLNGCRKKAELIEEFFPFDAGNVGPQLTATREGNGAIGFGPVPPFVHHQPEGLGADFSEAYGWRPQIVSLGYLTIPPEGVPPVPHTVTIRLVGQQLDTSDTKGAGPTDIRWQQLVGTFTGTTGFRLQNISVPVDETNGQPYGLRITTQDREQASMVIIDWEWGRAVRDTDRELLIALAQGYGR